MPKELLLHLVHLAPLSLSFVFFLLQTSFCSLLGDTTQVLLEFILPFSVYGWEWVYMSLLQCYPDLQKDFISLNLDHKSTLVAVGWGILDWYP